MKSSSMLAIIIALLAIISAMAVTFNSDDTSAVEDEDEYVITYYGAIEGIEVLNNTQTVVAGESVVLPAAPENEYRAEYIQIGWLYNGEEYAVGDEIIPESDITITVVWEPVVTLASEVQSPAESSTIYVLVLGAAIAIFVIISAVVIQRKKVDA